VQKRVKLIGSARGKHTKGSPFSAAINIGKHWKLVVGDKISFICAGLFTFCSFSFIEIAKFTGSNVASNLKIHFSPQCYKIRCLLSSALALPTGQRTDSSKMMMINIARY
jgi:hypothetical protein